MARKLNTTTLARDIVALSKDVKKKAYYRPHFSFPDKEGKCGTILFSNSYVICKIENVLSFMLCDIGDDVAEIAFKLGDSYLVRDCALIRDPEKLFVGEVTTDRQRVDSELLGNVLKLCKHLDICPCVNPEKGGAQGTFLQYRVEGWNNLYGIHLTAIIAGIRD